MGTDTATGNANGGACTAPAADPPACTDTAVETDGVWAETDGTACTAAADDSADDAALESLTCESADDCEGEGMVCMETSLDSVDQEHADWTAEAEELATALLPLKACMDSAACEEAATAAGEDESFVKLAISCGATKLVAGFAALALAS